LSLVENRFRDRSLIAVSLSSPDIEAYLRRVNYSGSVAPTLELLNALTFLHATSIPFENLDILHGQAISLEAEALVDKLIRRHRGGYCFEQNGLFLLVLQTLGFDARPLSARVRLQYPRNFTPPRTHLFLDIKIGSTHYLADVGVGAASLTSALRFELNSEQQTPHDVRRIVFEEGRYFHQIRYGQQWNDVYEFTLEEMPLVDREVGNWYTSTHPKSHFKNRLIVAMAQPNSRRITIVDDEFGERRADGSSRHLCLDSQADLLRVLRECFGLDFPDGTRFNAT
jgi:N-hydroxyarylamine O-acetyltransferase